MMECEVCLGAGTVMLNTYKRAEGTYMVTGQRTFPCPACHRMIINRDVLDKGNLQIIDSKAHMELTSNSPKK